MPRGFSRAVFIGFWVTILELWSCVVGLNSNSSVLDNFGSENSLQSENGSQGVHLASWNFDYVSPAYEITVFVLLAGLVKIGKCILVRKCANFFIAFQNKFLLKVTLKVFSGLCTWRAIGM